MFVVPFLATHKDTGAHNFCEITKNLRTPNYKIRYNFRSLWLKATSQDNLCLPVFKEDGKKNGNSQHIAGKYKPC